MSRVFSVDIEALEDLHKMMNGYRAECATYTLLNIHCDVVEIDINTTQPIVLKCHISPNFSGLFIHVFEGVSHHCITQLNNGYEIEELSGTHIFDNILNQIRFTRKGFFIR